MHREQTGMDIKEEEMLDHSMVLLADAGFPFSLREEYWLCAYGILRGT